MPGDISSAAFFMVAAMLFPDSDLLIENVGLNPTRAALVDFLLGMGANIKITHVEQLNHEVVGSLRIKSGRVLGGVLEKSMAAKLIDEIPVLSVLGAVSENGLVVRDAKELRVKETDRIETVATNLRAMGIQVTVREDGMEIPGNSVFVPRS